MKRIPDPNKMRRVKGPKLSRKELKAAKVRITTYLDQEVLENLKACADESGSRYQTLLNQILRERFFEEDQNISVRIKRLEEAVFKKAA